MSYIYTHCDHAEAQPLYWESTQVTVCHTEQTVGAESTSDPVEVCEQQSVLGLKTIVPDLANDPKWASCKVIDNVVNSTDAGSIVYNDVTITTTGGTKIATTKPVEGFSLTLMCPALYKIGDNGYEETSVVVGIYYRVKDSTGSWRTVDAAFTISAKQRAEIIKTVSVPNCKDGLNYYEILVVRVTSEHTGDADKDGQPDAFDYADDVYIKDLTEINYSSIAYNNTALLGVKIRATDQLSGQPPAVTCIVHGTKVAIPGNLLESYKTRYDEDGNYSHEAITAAYTGVMGTLSSEKVWTDNPVWCLYDLLTNTRYGLGEYYKIADSKRGLMLANFYLMAKYCDYPVKYTDESGINSADKWRPRFTLNMVIDQSKSASEWIGQICSLMRASLYYSEGIFWIDIDRPKVMSQIFNMTNITEYTQSCTSFREIPNSYEVQWVNPKTDYEIDSFKLEDIALQLDDTLEERKKALTLVGSTNFDQAKSLAKYALLTGKYCTKLVTFKTGTDALRSMVGDVIGIQHDVPLWGWGGEIVSFDAATREITLSAPFTPSEGMELVISACAYNTNVPTDPDPLIDTGWDGSPITVAKVGGTHSYSSDTPLKYVIGKQDASIAPFRIASIKRSADEMCEVTAVEYQEELYSMCDDASDTGVFDPNDYSLLPDINRVSVSNVHASLKMFKDLGGNEKVGVEVFYTPPKSSVFWKSAQVYWAKVGSTNFSTMAPGDTGYFFIETINEPGDYLIVVTSIYTNGKQTITDARNDKEKHPWTTITVTAYNPDDDVFYEGVTGLAIENKANDGTFIGKDCILVWRKPVALAVQSNASKAGATTAGSSASSTWTGDYEVTISGVESGVRRKSMISQERFVYTHEMNYSDAIDGDADRFFTCTVVAYDKLGRKSKPKSIDCYNPAPKKMSVL